MRGLCNGITLQFRQAIHKVVARRRQTEVLSKIDDAYPCRYRMLTQEGFTLAMTETEEQNVHFIEGHLGRKLQIGIAVETFVNIGHLITGIALTVNEDNLDIGMIDQQTSKLASRITGTT